MGEQWTYYQQQQQLRLFITSLVALPGITIKSRYEPVNQGPVVRSLIRTNLGLTLINKTCRVNAGLVNLIGL